MTQPRSSGTLDAAWNPATDSATSVAALHLSDNGYLYLGGWFEQLDGYSLTHLARVSATDGHADHDWNPAPSGDGAVLTLAPAGGASLAVGGSFCIIGNEPRERLAILPLAQPMTIFGDGFDAAH